jgi:hypothetical protein
VFGSIGDEMCGQDGATMVGRQPSRHRESTALAPISTASTRACGWASAVAGLVSVAAIFALKMAFR